MQSWMGINGDGDRLHEANFRIFGHGTESIFGYQSTEWFTTIMSFMTPFFMISHRKCGVFETGIDWRPWDPWEGSPCAIKSSTATSQVGLVGIGEGATDTADSQGLPPILGWKFHGFHWFPAVPSHGTGIQLSWLLELASGLQQSGLVKQAGNQR